LLFAAYAPQAKTKAGKNKRTWKAMSSEECRLARMWSTEDGLPITQIAKLLRRNKSAISRQLASSEDKEKPGRQFMLSEAQVDRLVKKTKEYIKQAKGRYRITYALLKKRTRTKASIRTIQRAFVLRNITYKKMREKPLLTDQDVKDRFKFSVKYKGKSLAWWIKYIQLHIDCKWFKVFLNGKARAFAAQQKVWGAFRGYGDGDGLKDPYVKSRKDLKYNTGARGVMVLAGVGKGKVLLWEYLHKKRWNAKTAAEMYEGPMAKALRKAYPRRRSFKVLEDNDPSGFKTKKATVSKKRAKISSFDLPKRSPQLNVLDYAVWSEISTRMRAQERRWPVNKKETREKYLARLRRTALRLPPKFINSSIKNMKERCQRLHKAKGGHIEEGGGKKDRERS